MEPVFTYPHEVIYADTDAGGVVYYAVYLTLFERARALYVREFGLSLAGLAAEGALFVCRRAEIDYHSPALLGDRLNVSVWIPERGRAYLDFRYTIDCVNRGDSDIEPVRVAEGYTRMACCRAEGGAVRPCRIPAAVLERLTRPAPPC